MGENQPGVFKKCRFEFRKIQSADFFREDPPGFGCNVLNQSEIKTNDLLQV